jgi:hypothetical protein
VLFGTDAAVCRYRASCARINFALFSVRSVHRNPMLSATMSRLSAFA